VLATLDRREEAYHAEVLAGPGGAASVVDGSRQATFKEEGLADLVRVDAARRKMFVDHFWDLDVDPAAGTSPIGDDVFVLASPPHAAMNSAARNGNHRFLMSARVG
ncbi:MAG: DUF1926 domain-containing protein, partial [Acidimicrobiia bacterium]|nr:DUF1926 domain-containing protein [Acidimicrobiia bacterium]